MQQRPSRSYSGMPMWATDHRGPSTRSFGHSSLPMESRASRMRGTATCLQARPTRPASRLGMTREHSFESSIGQQICPFLDGKRGRDRFSAGVPRVVVALSAGVSSSTLGTCAGHDSPQRKPLLSPRLATRDRPEDGGCDNELWVLPHWPCRWWPLRGWMGTWKEHPSCFESRLCPSVCCP